ncbi:GDP-L-fucose synthase family protein [Christiangramia echinicola]|uniref:GDP-L-fucose synthase family protein n=1 Tax=Christiangramia echinicola TaxID=279359 RepID=UPI0009FFD4FF|nr:GDP-L-fucose synthase [Christiangramia echinicola]
MKIDSKIYIAGHNGLVGRALMKILKLKGYHNLIGKTHDELDLTNAQAVREFFKKEQPEIVFLAAAKVGGISANNTYRAEFIYENLMIQSNVIHQSYKHGVKKLLFLGSTCIYPKHSPQPIKEENLLTGSLEYSNEPYAIAKIAGIKMCEAYNLQYGTNFLAVMPTNLYGPGDNFDLEKSHVLPALMRKMYLGKLLEEKDLESLRRHLKFLPISGLNINMSLDNMRTALEQYGIKLINGKVNVEIWGSGKPLRQFLYSEDMADACIFLMENIDFEDLVKEFKVDNSTEEIRNTHLNIGSCDEISIKDLAYMVKDIIGFNGKLYFNTSKMDGTLKKTTDNSRIKKYGWTPKVGLTEGIQRLSEEMNCALSINISN